MNTAVEITFRNMPDSDAIRAAILKRISQLKRVFDHIIGCSVMIEAPHRHHKKGKHYHVRIDLSVPGKEIVVSRDPSLDATRSDAYVAIRDSFDAAQRQLKNYWRVRRGYVKSHEPVLKTKTPVMPDPEKVNPLGFSSNNFDIWEQAL